MKDLLQLFDQNVDIEGYLHVSASDARRTISDLLKRVEFRGDRVVVTNHGKPTAALVHINDLRRLLRQDAKMDNSVPLLEDLSEAEVLLNYPTADSHKKPQVSGPTGAMDAEFDADY